MIGVIVPKGDDKLFGALLFQKDKQFQVYVPEGDPVADAYEAQLPLVRGGLKDVQEQYVWILEPGAMPDKDFLRRARRTIERHPEFHVYHANLTQGEQLPRIVKRDKLFTKLVLEGIPAPLSSCVFATARLRERSVFRADGTLDPLPTLLACASEKGLRNIWQQQLEWTSPTLAEGPAEEEKRIRERLDFYRWTESFYGDDYPVGTGDRLELIAIELAKLYPSYSEESLKDMIQSFQAASGAVRKLRASSALKTALKARLKQLR